MVRMDNNIANMEKSIDWPRKAITMTSGASGT